MCKIWNDDENTLLTKLWKRSDITSGMLATVFTGRTPGAIKSHASVLGLRKESITNIDYEALKAIEI
ncbi:hypothetical protein KA005_37725 [bacterium]|nr:hypothetical protein [bacterium]